MSSIPSDLTRLMDDLQIKNLIYAIAYVQDWLDYPFMDSIWHPTTITFDLSSHLPDYEPSTMTAAELVEQSRLALSGFEGTQHLVNNLVVNFDQGSEDRAEVTAQVLAYHYLEGDHVTARNSWKVRVVRMAKEQGVPEEQQAKLGDMGTWVAVGIKVERDIPLEGNVNLYQRAKGRAQRGLGRMGRA